MTHFRRPQEVRVLAPAKLNLGLEVVGRRPDGYHDIVTILQAIDLWDQVEVRTGDDVQLVRPVLGVPIDENLALRAVALLREHAGTARGARVEIRKRIPSAAGLGGASADAAAALLAARDLWKLETPMADLAALALRLGSDVPFFLRGRTALASGQGDILEPLPSPRFAAVVVVPRVAIARKTATLYGLLTPADFGNGSRVRAQAHRLRAGQPLDPDLLGNAFSRPLYALRPELAELPGVMRAHGAGHVALSGAGPSHYALFADHEAAAATARRLRGALGPAATVIATRDRDVEIGTSVSNR